MSRMGDLLFDRAGQSGFFSQSGIEGHGGLSQFRHFERIGEVEGHALVIGETVAEFFQKETHFEMTHRIRRHH